MPETKKRKEEQKKKRISLEEAMQKAKESLQAVVNLKLSGIIEVCSVEDGWRVTLEFVERAAVPDAQDLLGVYEVRLSEEGQMLGYERTRVRRRSDLEERAG